jgi:hypothetical protein
MEVGFFVWNERRRGRRERRKERKREVNNGANIRCVNVRIKKKISYNHKNFIIIKSNHNFLSFLTPSFFPSTTPSTRIPILGVPLFPSTQFTQKHLFHNKSSSKHNILVDRCGREDGLFQIKLVGDGERVVGCERVWE